MATEAGGVEGELPVGPIERLVRAARKMPHAAGRHVVPFFLVHVVGHGQHLQPAAIQRGEKVIDILAAHHVVDRVFLLAVGTSFNDAARSPAISARYRESPITISSVWGESLFGPTQRYTAAWPARGEKAPTTGRISRGISGNSQSRYRNCLARFDPISEKARPPKPKSECKTDMPTPATQHTERQCVSNCDHRPPLVSGCITA